MKVLIQKMKQQTCWTILRHFGYNEKLQIRQNIWDDGSLKDEDIEECKNTELSKDANQYLKRLFEAHMNEVSQKLEESGMERIFATTELGMPWRARYETKYENGVTFDIWIALWQRFMSECPKEAFKNLVYIGYCARMKDAIHIVKKKLSNQLKISERKVFNCYVFGHQSWVVLLS